MAGVYCGTGLGYFMEYGLQGNASYNNNAALFESSSAPTHASTSASLDMDTTTVPYASSLSWSYTQTAYVETATVTVVWNLPSSFAGKEYYGAAIYSTSGGGNPLYAEAFPSPWTVPSGGGSFAFQFNLTFGNCSDE